MICKDNATYYEDHWRSRETDRHGERERERESVCV